MDHDAVRVIGRNGFAELLHGPLSRGICRDTNVKESATGMFNNHKDIQGAKRRRDCDTKVTGHDPLGMIAKKRCPALRVTARAWATDAVTRHIFPHRSRRHAQAELEQQFVGNTLLSLRRIL